MVGKTGMGVNGEERANNCIISRTFRSYIFFPAAIFFYDKILYFCRQDGISSSLSASGCRAAHAHPARPREYAPKTIQPAVPE
jgi:hypothetical protein